MPDELKQLVVGSGQQPPQKKNCSYFGVCGCGNDKGNKQTNCQHLKTSLFAQGTKNALYQPNSRETGAFKPQLGVTFDFISWFVFPSKVKHPKNKTKKKKKQPNNGKTTTTTKKNDGEEVRRPCLRPSPHELRFVSFFLLNLFPPHRGLCPALRATRPVVTIGRWIS